jgi:hypothetical protein
MIQIQVRNVARQVFRVHQPGVGVLGRVTCDRTCLGDGLAHRRGAEVSRAGRALALAEIHRHPEAAVTLIFDRVDLAQTHAHRQSLTDRGIRLALRGALAPRLLERKTRNFGQGGGGSDGGLHRADIGWSWLWA